MAKIVVVGDPLTGKSTFINSISGQNGKYLIFHDASTQQELPMECLEGCSEMAQNALCVIIVFDLTRADTFNRTKILHTPEISLMVNKSKSFLVLVGNKSDQTERRQVTQEEGERFAGEAGMFYVEVSALAQKNIDIVQKIIRIRSSFLLKTKLLPISAEAKSLQSSSEKIRANYESGPMHFGLETNGTLFNSQGVQKTRPLKPEFQSNVIRTNENTRHSGIYTVEQENKENFRFNPNTSGYVLTDQEIIQAQLYNSGQTQPGERTQINMFQQTHLQSDLKDPYGSVSSHQRQFIGSPPMHQIRQNELEQEAFLKKQGNQAYGNMMAQSIYAGQPQNYIAQKNGRGLEAQKGAFVSVGSHVRQNSMPSSSRETEGRKEYITRASQIANENQKREKDKKQFEDEIHQLELSIKKLEGSNKKSVENCLEEPESNENFMESIKKPKAHAKSNQYTFGKHNLPSEICFNPEDSKNTYFSSPIYEENQNVSVQRPECMPLTYIKTDSGQIIRKSTDIEGKNKLSSISESQLKKNNFSVQFSISLTSDFESINISLNDNPVTLAQKILAKSNPQTEFDADIIALAKAIEKESQTIFPLLGGAKEQKPAQNSGPLILGTKVFPRSISSSSLSEKNSSENPLHPTYSSMNSKKPVKNVPLAQKSKSSAQKDQKNLPKDKAGSQKPPLTKAFAKVDLSDSRISTQINSLEDKENRANSSERDTVIGSLNIQLQDGSYKELLVRKNDKPETVASSFLRSHALKQVYYDKLVKNIKDMKKEWACAQLPSQEHLDEQFNKENFRPILKSNDQDNFENTPQALVFPPKNAYHSQNHPESSKPIELAPQSYRSGGHQRRSSESAISSQRFFSGQAAYAESPKVRIY